MNVLCRCETLITLGVPQLYKSSVTVKSVEEVILKALDDNKDNNKLLEKGRAERVAELRKLKEVAKAAREAEAKANDEEERAKLKEFTKQTTTDPADKEAASAWQNFKKGKAKPASEKSTSGPSWAEKAKEGQKAEAARNAEEASASQSQETGTGKKKLVLKKKKKDDE